MANFGADADTGVLLCVCAIHLTFQAFVMQPFCPCHVSAYASHFWLNALSCVSGITMIWFVRYKYNKILQCAKD